MADFGSQSSKFIGLKSNAGFLAIQGMIGAAIVGIMLAVLMTVVGHLSDMSSKYIAKEELDMVMQNVQNVLLTENTCNNSLSSSPLSFSGGEIPVDQIVVRSTSGTSQFPLIRRESRPILENSGQRYDGRIRIENITLREVTANSGRSIERFNVPNPMTGDPFTEYTSYITHLAVTSSFGGNSLPEQTIALKVFTDSSGLIQKCFSLSTDTETCAAFGGSIDVDGRCQLPICDQSTIGSMGSRGIPCSDLPGCVNRPRAYFWVFQGGEAGKLSQPICICLEHCQ